MSLPDKHKLINQIIIAGMEWPVECDYAVQDRNGDIKVFYNIPHFFTAPGEWSRNGNAGRKIGNRAVVDNYKHVVVSRSEYATRNGFILNEGVAPRHLSDDTMVEVEFRCKGTDKRAVCGFRWDIAQSQYDIIAYRPIVGSCRTASSNQRHQSPKSIEDLFSDLDAEKALVEQHNKRVEEIEAEIEAALTKLRNPNAMTDDSTGKKSRPVVWDEWKIGDKVRFLGYDVSHRLSAYNFTVVEIYTICKDYRDNIGPADNDGDILIRPFDMRFEYV